MSDETFFMIDLAAYIISIVILTFGLLASSLASLNRIREEVAVPNPSTKFGTVTSSPPGFQRHLGLED